MTFVEKMHSAFGFFYLVFFKDRVGGMDMVVNWVLTMALCEVSGSW